jgi:uroporphyrinogen III methyltransferase / synthase
MPTERKAALKIAVCGSASVGKTTLVEMLASSLGLSLIREEMRDYIESSGQRLSDASSCERSNVLLRLWQRRQAAEADHRSFVADNSSLDFAAYALHYGCVTEQNAPEFLHATAEAARAYNLVVVLGWGAIPYVRDGIRGDDEYEQFRYQLLIEGLLRRHVDAARLRFVPQKLTTLRERVNWVTALLSDRAGRAANEMVYLVGAGPGNPSLLTMRAAQLLKQADVVAHDALISPDILALVNSTAEVVYVGRRYGDGESHPPLHPVVLDRAKAGLRVVRLKSGDPFIFGRGGEEGEELRKNGIPFEVVPGISAAFGAAAYAGIPLTDRRYASEVLIASGHEQGGDERKPAAQRTTVLYMAGNRLGANIASLLETGYSQTTPVALVANATTRDQQVVTGTLGDIEAKIDRIPARAPVLIMVGETVALREKINWFDDRPVAGKRILVARARPGTSSIAERCRELGAQVWESPHVVPDPLPSYEQLDSSLVSDEFDHVVVGCQWGAEAVVNRARTLGVLAHLSFVAIGSKAASALEALGLSPLHVIAGSCRDGVQRSSEFLRGKHVLAITSDQGRPHLLDVLSEICAAVRNEPAYHTRFCFEDLTSLPSELDMIVLPSSSAARLLLTREEIAQHQSTPAVVIGPFTEAAAEEWGASRLIRTETDDVEAVVAAVVEELTK